MTATSRIALKILLAVTFVVPSGTSLAAVPGLPSAEQEVIESFLGAQDTSPGSKEQALWETASAASLDFGRGNGTLQELLHRVVSSRGPAYAEAVEDMLKKNQAAARIGDITNALRPVHLVSESAYPNILVDNDASFDEWILFYERFPSCSRVMTVSRVGIETKGSVAALCYGLKEPYRPAVVRFEAMRRDGNRWVILTRIRSGTYERYVCTSCGVQKSVEVSKVDAAPDRKEVSFHPSLVSRAIGTNGCQHSWLLYACGRIDRGDYILSELPGGKAPTFSIHALLSSPRFVNELAAMDQPHEEWHQLVTALSTNWALDRSLDVWSAATPERSYTAWWQQSPLARTNKP